MSEIYRQARVLDETVWTDTDRSLGLGSRVLKAMEQNHRGGKVVIDGLPGSSWDVTGTSRSTEQMTTVERAVLSRERGNPKDPVGELAEQILGYWKDIYHSRNALVNALQRFDKMAGGRHSTTDECCEPYCTDPAVKAGRCTNDYMRKRRYESEHGGAPCPPLSEAEHLERTQRRQRVV